MKSCPGEQNVSEFAMFFSLKVKMQKKYLVWFFTSQFCQFWQPLEYVDITQKIDFIKDSI
jgi:hypothetical protein